jgi:hypothetical protein
VVEWEEWGNPNEAKYFAYMKSYSPLDNVVRRYRNHPERGDVLPVSLREWCRVRRGMQMH